jgi:ribose 5-phosphate isomerase B
VRIAVAADHNGLALKARLVARLTAAGHELDDRGVHGEGTVDYPPLCEDVCRQVSGGRADRGIVIGGSGAGEAVACNKMPGIRAGLCSDPFTTEVSRANNDSNVLVLGAKVVSPELADELVDIWLRTAFRGGVHQRRIEMIAALERGETLLG